MDASPATNRDPPAETRIRILETLVRDLSRARDPDALLDRFTAGMQAAYGRQATIFVAVRDEPPGGYVITRFVREDGEEAVRSADVRGRDPSLPVHVGGFVSDVIAAGRPRLLTNLEIADDPVLGTSLASYHSALVLPVFDEGAIRFWALLLHRDPTYYDERELETMLLRVNVFSTLIGNARLTQDLQKANRWIQDEIDQIAMVQRSLLPPSLPAIPGLDLAARFETYDRAGGDYYDLRPWGRVEDGHEPSRWMWLVADASGHGPAAAVIVAMLHMLLRTLPMPDGGPPELLAEMNDRLFACNTCNHFMTAFVGCYETATRELTYAVAGHHPPLLRAPDRSVARLAVNPAVPLGILDGVEAPTGRMRLDEGAVLLMYTDGLTDAQNAADEPFGEARLMEVLAGAHGDAGAILAEVCGAVRAHQGTRRAGDDQTAVVVRVLGG